MCNQKIIKLKTKIDCYFNKYNKDFVINHIKKNNKKEYEKKLIGANLLLNNSFIFDSDWDMEQCNVPYRIDPFKWDYSANGDEEWIFMLNRHEFLNKLIMAYYIEKNEKYIEKLKWFIFNWIDENEINIKGGNTTRTIDTGIRCLAWIEVLIHLINEDKLNDEEILKIIYSMEEQIKYLKNSYIGKYTLSNWGVLQTTAICSVYLWLDDFLEDKEIKKWAERELYNQIEMQVFDDGTHWEQSLMYHIEVLNSSMKLINYGDKLNKQLDFKFKEKIEKMCEYLVYAKSPRSTQEAQGDSDRTDVRDCLVKGSVLFNNKIMKKEAFKVMDLMSILMLGEEGYNKFNSICGVEPKNINKNFEDSGNIYLRDNFLEDSSFTYMQNGTLGSSHGHVDLGHISIYHKGKPYFIDSGRYTYVNDDPMREYLKSYKAHNVCIIDDDPHGIPNKSWSYHKYGDCLKNYYNNKEKMSYIEMPFTGELTGEETYLINRKIIHISEGIWIVINDIKCNGKHKVKTIYNLDSDVEIKKENKYIELINKSDALRLYSEDKFEVKNGYISKNYNEINNNKKLVKENEFINKNLSYDIILKDSIKIEDIEIKQFNNENKIKDERIISKKFILSKEESYIIIVFNKETYKGGKVYYCDNIPFYGKVVIIHKKGNNNKVVRLKV